MRRKHHRAVQHCRNVHVVHKWRIAQSLLYTSEPRSGRPDAVFPVAFGQRGRVAIQAELFAEVEMVPRLVSGHLVVVVPRFPGSLYRVDNPLVARAAAEVAIERLANGFTA